MIIDPTKQSFKDNHKLMIGSIVMFHVDDKVYKDGRINLKELNPIGRLAGNSYTRVFDNFNVIRHIKPN